MKHHKKKKGYVLIIVMILCFVMSMSVVSASPLLFRYMNKAKKNLHGLAEEGKEIYYSTWEVQNDASI